MASTGKTPAAVAWKRRLDTFLELPGKPKSTSLEDTIGMLPMILRLRGYVNRERKAGRKPTMDPFNAPNPGPVGGVPLGGLGAGSIMRGWQGDFSRVHLHPGDIHYEMVPANQFSLYVQRPGQKAQMSVLSAREPAEGVLKGWGWGAVGKKSNYHALYPRAWTVYQEPDRDLTVTCRQITPVIAGDYEASNFPGGTFVYTLENTGRDSATVGVMFSFQNGTGGPEDRTAGHTNTSFSEKAKGGDVIGVALHHRQAQPGLDEPVDSSFTLGIAAQATKGVEVTYRTRFLTTSSGMDLWGDFRDGSLENTEDARASTDGMAIGGAVCATVEVPAGQTREIAFSLVWDMPVVRDGAGKGYYRRYTRFYGRDGQAVGKLAAAALTDYPAWEKAIEAWQGPILSQTGLPDWFKAALFNELYFLASGGSVWTDGEAGQKASKATDIGHFAYLESLEYLYVNTYDVHFYASFALAMLWPELELSLQRDFAKAINDEHLEIVEMMGSGERSERKIAGSLPHDLGAWGEQPWDKVNAYQFQDVSRWKDLNSKFVLQVYRDVVATGDKKFAKEMWEPVRAAMDYMLQFDLDEDGMIENDGFPDQTYDVWVADGVSAYSGGLWLAALSAAAALADMLKEDAAAKQYRKMLASAQEAYDELLWTGEYYAYDSGRHRHQNSIMADQMAGQWYARACGLPSIVPDDNARSALEKVFNYNVLMFEDGEMGAVNGMRPDGRVDTACMQSQEVWTGTTYAVAAAMIQEGLMDEAWETAKGVAHMTYTELGYWFQTPEAWNHEGDFRALGYMRPLAIWAMLWAWQRSAKPRASAQPSKGSRSTSKASASPAKKPAAKKKAK